MSRHWVKSLSALLLLVFAPAQADVLDDVLERGTLRVGVAEFAPWTMRDRSGELIGHEVDVAEKIATDMGVAVELRLYEWDDIIEALQRGDIDLIAGGMAITPARALQVNFTRPLADSGAGLVANTSMTKDIRTLTELNNKRTTIATVSDTMGESLAMKLFADAKIKVYKTAEEAKADLVRGDAHVYLGGMAEARFMAMQHPEALNLPINAPLLASSEALAVRKGEQELLNFLNAWVTARHADQWLETTRDYWFGTLDWVERVSK